MPSDMRFEGALFDMDGLLLCTEQVYLESFHIALQQMEFPFPERVHGVFQSMVGTSGPTGQAILHAEIAPHVDLEACIAIWDRVIAERFVKGIPVKPGAKELLARLQTAGLPIAVATSTKTPKAIGHLDSTGLLPMIQHVVGGDQVENSKPAPDIYLKAAESIGANVERCAAFEDSNIGIRAAVSSGAIAVQVPDLVSPDADTRALGHCIADDLLAGAKAIGLI